MFPTTPPTRLAALRILVDSFGVVYLLSRFTHLTNFEQLSARAFHPVGPVSLLSEPLPSSAVLALFLVALVSGIAAAVGYRYRAAGPVFGLSLLWVLSYRNSWGMIFHTENLLVLHALILGVAPAADAWSIDARDRVIPNANQRYGWAIQAMIIVVLLSYVVAGVAKLRAAGISWASGHELRSHIAFDAVRKLELGSVHSPFGAALVPHAWAFPPLAWLTLAFELGAPLALLGGRWARVWAVTAWGFHAGVLVLMAIVFPYALLGIAFAPLFEVERLFESWLLPWLSRLTQTATRRQRD